MARAGACARRGAARIAPMPDMPALYDSSAAREIAPAFTERTVPLAAMNIVVGTAPPYMADSRAPGSSTIELAEKPCAEGNFRATSAGSP